MMKRAFATLILIAVAAWGLAGPLSAAIPSTGSLAFQVLRSDSDIGRHEVTFRRQDGDLHVFVDIDLSVKLAFVTVFRYTHRNHEVWRDGRLVSIETSTNDNGEEYQLTGRATDEGFVVEGDAGRIVAPADIVPTSYWNPRTLEQTQLLDTQRGRLLDVSIDRIAEETIPLAETRIEAERYRVSGDLRLDLWYAKETGTWSKIAFEARGAEVTYLLDEALQREAALGVAAD